MAFYQQQSRVRQFVPTYVPRSDFIPAAQIIEVSEEDRLQILRDVEEDRRLGRVMMQRPVEFNPQRYVSYQVYENVFLDRSIPAEHLQGMIASRRF